ncbi:hypothetical protein [Paraburkholderia sp. 40]|uniref:hypothetical protein n=1 Tax=Paraburkholderia sp. 40 TaxID=2991059 RepID=UPI003D1A1D28
MSDIQGAAPFSDFVEFFLDGRLRSRFRFDQAHQVPIILAEKQIVEPPSAAGFLLRDAAIVGCKIAMLVAMVRWNPCSFTSSTVPPMAFRWVSMKAQHRERSIARRGVPPCVPYTVG